MLEVTIASFPSRIVLVVPWDFISPDLFIDPKKSYLAMASGIARILPLIKFNCI
jgi:hypothetical protein